MASAYEKVCICYDAQTVFYGAVFDIPQEYHSRLVENWVAQDGVLILNIQKASQK